MKYWWVSQNRTFLQESSGGYMWSPKLNKNGRNSHYYDNMTRIQPGDIIFSFAKGNIPAVGVATSIHYTSIKPHEFKNAGSDWEDEGWRVDVDYHFVDNQISPAEHMETLLPFLPQTYSPIQPSGRGNQAYLFEVPLPMAEELGRLIGKEFSELISSKVHNDENAIERDIRNSNSLDETEKEQLVKARRGQGLFKKNVANIESQCRLTGVSINQHLIASHIKPWRDCDNKERLDGNNGLLLAPHIDHLFDKGYISFKDNGSVLISSQLHQSVLKSWCINHHKIDTPFSSEQSLYLDYHRKRIFKK